MFIILHSNVLPYSTRMVINTIITPYHNYWYTIISGYNQYLAFANHIMDHIFLIGCSDWIGYWGKHMKATAFKSVREYQKVITSSKQIK